MSPIEASEDVKTDTTARRIPDKEISHALYPGGGGTPIAILGHTGGCAARMGEFSRPKDLRMGVNFFPKTCGWVIILIHKTFSLISISIILPGNGQFS